jgi:hypothetical protein
MSAMSLILPGFFVAFPDLFDEDEGRCEATEEEVVGALVEVVVVVVVVEAAATEIAEAETPSVVAAAAAAAASMCFLFRDRLFFDGLTGALTPIENSIEICTRSWSFVTVRRMDNSTNLR